MSKKRPRQCYIYTRSGCTIYRLAWVLLIIRDGQFPEPQLNNSKVPTPSFCYNPCHGSGWGDNLFVMEEILGSYLYHVSFIYKRNTYYCEFYSTAEITPETDKMVAWSLADDAIKARMESIPDKVAGVYPHAIILSGVFGKLVIKE